MASPTSDAYSSPSGDAVHAGLYGSGLRGDAALSGLAAGGSMTSASTAASISGSADLLVMEASGAMSGTNIVGTVWTPNRDAGGDILVSDWNNLPLHQWLTVAGAASSLRSAIETPVLPASSGGDSSRGITKAWGGMAWDYFNGVGYINGGGHSDSHMCETGIYKIELSKLTFSRIVNRQPTSQVQYWNGSALVPGNQYPDHNNPLLNGVPGSVHTYHQLEFVPASTLGNVGGGIFLGGNAKSTFDLDTNTYKTTHWNADNLPGVTDWSYGIALHDSGAIYRPRSSFRWERMILSGSQASSWSPTSFGQLNTSYAISSINFVYNNKCYAHLRERRECVSLAGASSGVRVRYGQAVDAGATDWTSYHNAITLTSLNGVDHLDFNSANLLDGASPKLCAAGTWYEHANETLWVQGNQVGDFLYRITGIASNTWTVEKVAGTGALVSAGVGTYSKFAGGVRGFVTVAFRITGTDDQVQVIRLR